MFPKQKYIYINHSYYFTNLITAKRKKCALGTLLSIYKLCKVSVFRIYLKQYE